MTVNTKASENIIITLSSLPEFLRRPILKRRLEEFFHQDTQERSSIVIMALEAAPKVDRNKLAVLVRTWMEILSTFEGDKIFIMLESYCTVIYNNPAILDNLDIGSLTESFNSLEDTKKEILGNVLKEVILNFPDRSQITAAIPAQAKAILDL